MNAPIRQIVLDTETTGLDHRQGHRIIEIGCVELINRKLTNNNFHFYLNPEREIEQGAIEVHGIKNEFLQDKPLFADVSDRLIRYLHGAELIIHNAPFDVGFLNAELERLDVASTTIEEVCSVYDTLVQARKMFPGQRNDLDSLCKRYEVSNVHRELHGALLDAEILADVYLAMTGGQASLSLEAAKNQPESNSFLGAKQDFSRMSFAVVKPNSEERSNHQQWLNRLDESVQGKCVWSKINQKIEKQVE